MNEGLFGRVFRALAIYMYIYILQTIIQTNVWTSHRGIKTPSRVELITATFKAPLLQLGWHICPDMGRSKRRLPPPPTHKKERERERPWPLTRNDPRELLWLLIRDEPGKVGARLPLPPQLTSKHMIHVYEMWLIHMRQDSFIWDIIHLYETLRFFMRRDSFIWDVTHLCETWFMRHDSFKWNMIHSYGTFRIQNQTWPICMGHDSVMWDIAFIWDVTNSYRRDSFMWDMPHQYETWRIHVRRDSFIWDRPWIPLPPLLTAHREARCSAKLQLPAVWMQF